MRQSEDYLSHIKTVVTDFKAGQPLSSKTIIAMRQDKAYEQGINSMQRWQQAAKELGYSEVQCQRIKKLTEIYKQGCPLPELAAMAIHQDLSRYEQQRSQFRVQEQLEQLRQEQKLGNRASIDRDQDNEYEL